MYRMTNRLAFGACDFVDWSENAEPYKSFFNPMGVAGYMGSMCLAFRVKTVKAMSYRDRISNNG
jgi:hypothetical protein